MEQREPWAKNCSECRFDNRNMTHCPYMYERNKNFVVVLLLLNEHIFIYLFR
jgi:hypothetical protein